ncbi:MAG: NADPH:quinone oxidoreductase family protein [Alphaproteobacteria bacterium]|nr:NADPH:quinone oxidoreductase family protein [Alphaproteobacteria bacterium]
MRAVVCRQWCEPEALTIEDLPAPELSSGQVRIGVRHAGVSFATRLVIAGKYQRRPPLPFVPGTEASGIVLETAPDVTRLAAGDPVMAILDWGGHAEEAVVPQETVYPLPAELDPALAVHLPLSYGTAYAALLWRASLQAGETLLVHGAAGAVGMAAVEIGRFLGARVIATASSEEKRAIARAHGAHETLDIADAGWRDKVKRLTDGRGADVIFDPIGGEVFDLSLRCIAQDGRLLTIGYASGRIPAAPANLLLVKQAAVIGLNFGIYVGWGLTDERRRHQARMQAAMAELCNWWRAGIIAPTVSHRFPLARHLEAYRVIAERRSVGKAVLDLA